TFDRRPADGLRVAETQAVSGGGVVDALRGRHAEVAERQQLAAAWHAGCEELRGAAAVLVHEMIGHGVEHVAAGTCRIVARRDLAAEPEAARRAEIFARDTRR